MKLSKFPSKTLDINLSGEYEGVVLQATQEASVGSMTLLIEVISQEHPPLRQAVEALSNLLVGWNLEEEDGSPMPLTTENIERIPFSMLMAILEGWFKEFSTPGPLGG